MQLLDAIRRRIRRSFRPPDRRDPKLLAPLAAALRLDLSGHVALVTGGSGELGRVITRTLSACGASVAVHYHKGQERALELVAEIKASGRPAFAVYADVVLAYDVRQMNDEITAALGPVDILVNNAVSWAARMPLLEQPIDDFDSVYNTCVRQAVLTAQAFVPSMVERRWGRVIGISTEVVAQALPDLAPYTAGKCGLDGTLRALAREVGRYQVTVNQVAPGWIITDKDREWRDERKPEYERGVPLRRRGYDQDVANAVAFLSSDLASFMTGVYLPVCGGSVMPSI